MEQGNKGTREQGAKQPNSTTDRLTGFRNARDENDPPPDDHCWIAAYRTNWTNQTVLLASLAKPITDTLKRKTWATLIRDEGWAFPLRYLAHVEKLLAGAPTPVELFNTDGHPTPGQRAREQADERERADDVISQIRAARQASQTNQEAIHRARLDARHAFTHALTNHPPRNTAPSTT